MGVAWAIVLGNWLSAAAPAGVVAGFVAGGLLMLLVAACYAELSTTLPQAGGDVVYALELFGPWPAFCVGWFLVLMAISITSFEAISLAWFVSTIAPGYEGKAAYRLFGHDVNSNALLIGLTLIAAITFVNYRGAASSSRLQDVFTALKALAAVAFIWAALAHGQAANLLPAGTPVLDQPAWLGALWIAATAPVWFGGFQVVPQAIEERGPRTSLRSVAHMTVLSVGIGIVFYCAIVLASAYIMPWRSLVAEPLPAVSAIRAAFLGGLGGSLVLAAIALGILATWNACFLWATHLLFAMGRLRLAPAWLASTNAHGAPGRASLFVGAVGLAGVFLGRGGLVPIINMATISLALSYAVCCSAALRLRQRDPGRPRPYRVIGGVITLRLAVAVSAVMALFALIEPLTRSHGWPLEWTLMLAWAGAGALAWRMTRDRRRELGANSASSLTP
jgi:amino acid transporter